MDCEQGLFIDLTPSVQKYSILKSCGSQQSKFDVANYILQVMNWTPQSIIWIRNSCAEFNLPIRVWTGTLKMWYLRKNLTMSVPKKMGWKKNRVAPQWFLVDQELSEDWKYLGPINQSFWRIFMSVIIPQKGIDSHLWLRRSELLRSVGWTPSSRRFTICGGSSRSCSQSQMVSESHPTNQDFRYTKKARYQLATETRVRT